jgi:hypothetical protein
MDNPAGGRRRPSGPKPRGAILGSITLPGEPGQVARARGLVARVLESAGLPGVDSDAATLLTSELVTNAIVHTDSGRRGGTVTVIVSGLPEGALVEVATTAQRASPSSGGTPSGAGARDCSSCSRRPRGGAPAGSGEHDGLVPPS